MKTLLIGINSKYIHTNLAIRLLKANTKYEIDIKEFTIKDDLSFIVDYVTNNKYDLLGLSCYIWNIEFIKALIPLVKKSNPNTLILLGGPEVSYKTEEFFAHYPIDFIIRNEGEEAFDKLLEALHNQTSLTNIFNLTSKTLNNSLSEADTSLIKSPHYFDNDFINRIIYIETSRGCPYNCSYCMASLEKKVRFFDLELVKKDILYLMGKGAKIFKFLDRTFNTDLHRAISLFRFIIENHYPNTSFQFEITGDLLNMKIIDYLNQNAPKDLFRFEIGIQSTNPLTNKLVYRKQNQEKLFNNIKKIQEGNVIDLHLDLIAGLPMEDKESFAKTFDDVLNLRPLELQLGFLKLLKGTKIYDEINLYDYHYSNTAPYEIISNNVLSTEDVRDIKVVENVLEKYYNSHFMTKTITYLLDHETSAFAFFLAYGKAFEANYTWFNYNLDDLFVRLFDYLVSIKYDNIEYILFLMKIDYLGYFKLRPKIWWNRLDKKKRNEIIKNLKPNDNYTANDLYKNAMVEKYQNQLLIALYKDNKTNLFIIKDDN